MMVPSMFCLGADGLWHRGTRRREIWVALAGYLVQYMYCKVVPKVPYLMGFAVLN